MLSCGVHWRSIFWGVLFCSPLLRHTCIEDLLNPLRCRQYEWSFCAKHCFSFGLATGFQINSVNAGRPAWWCAGVRLFWLWQMVPSGVSTDCYMGFISKKELLLSPILQWWVSSFWEEVSRTQRCVVLSCGCNFAFLIRPDLDHISVHLCIICISSLARCLFRSWLTLNGAVCFLVLCLLWGKILYPICVWQIRFFLPVCGLFSGFWHKVFQHGEIFI